MTNIRLQFEARRYHATPWGRHVNEGVVEWPPSPYRLLRALYDVWQRKCAHLPESEVQSVFEALASSDPIFVLPKASTGHTRSYLSSNSFDPTDKNLVFDAFLVFGANNACYISWVELELKQSQRHTLAELLDAMNYLGRSESWITARIDEGPLPDGFVSEPLGLDSASGEIAVVASVVAPKEYLGKRSWFSALTVSSSEVLKLRMSSPPLLREVRYVRPLDCIDTDPPAKLVRSSARVRAILISLDGKVLPLVTSTIEIAEQVRLRLMRAHKKRMRDDESKISPLFSGKINGIKRADHGHLFILPISDDGHRISRVLLLSRLKYLCDDELSAVRCVTDLWQADKPKVRCVMSWQGNLNDDLAGKEMTEVVSLTPFVTVRHLRRGREVERFLEDEIRRECRNHGLPEVLHVDRLAKIDGKFDVVEYRLNRKKDPSRRGYAFGLTFVKPVRAPFSLGYGCHFGLGQFGAPRR